MCHAVVNNVIWCQQNLKTGSKEQDTLYMKLAVYAYICDITVDIDIFQVSAQGYKGVIFTVGILSSPSTMLKLQFIWRRNTFVWFSISVFHIRCMKVKQSHCRSGEALRILAGWGSQISSQSAHEGGKVVSPTHRPLLRPRKYSWYSFLLEAESTPGP